MRSFFIVLFVIGVAVFLFCFIQWCLALANISSKNDPKEIERILYWDLWITFSALYISIISILFKIFS